MGPRTPSTAEHFCSTLEACVEGPQKEQRCSKLVDLADTHGNGFLNHDEFVQLLRESEKSLFNREEFTHSSFEAWNFAACFKLALFCSYLDNISRPLLFFICISSSDCDAQWTSVSCDVNTTIEQLIAKIAEECQVEGTFELHASQTDTLTLTGRPHELDLGKLASNSKLSACNIDDWSVLYVLPKDPTAELPGLRVRSGHTADMENIMRGGVASGLSKDAAGEHTFSGEFTIRNEIIVQALVRVGTIRTPGEVI